MKMILILIIFLNYFTHHIYAKQDILVQSLDLGNCWLQQIREEKLWKFASFSQGHSVYIDKHQVQSYINMHLKDYFIQHYPFVQFPASSYQTWIYCNFKPVFLLSFNQNAPGLCVWLDLKNLNANNQNSLIGVYPAGHTDPQIPCLGYKPGELMITTNGQNQAMKIVNVLSQNEVFRNAINKIEINSNFDRPLIQLTKKWHFKESDFIDILLENDIIKNNIKNIEFNNMVISSGEPLYLFKAQFSGIP